MIKRKKYWNIDVVRPEYSKDHCYVKDIYSVVKKTDKENWSFFSEEKEKDFAVDFLDYGELTRLIYVNNRPVAYISCYLLKPHADILLQQDYYHEIGLSLQDLRIAYNGQNEIYHDNSLYINVIAICERYQGSVELLKAVALALKDILAHNFFVYKLPKKVYTVGVTENGSRMCQFFNFNLESVAERKYGETINKRMLYKLETEFLIEKLSKILK